MRAWIPYLGVAVRRTGNMAFENLKAVNDPSNHNQHCIYLCHYFKTFARNYAQKPSACQFTSGRLF